MGSNKCTRILFFLLMPLALPALFIPAVNAAPLGTIIYQDGFTVDGVERQYGGNLNLTTIEGALLKWVAPNGMIFSSINGQDVVSSTVQNSNGAVINSDLSLVGGTVKVEIDAMPLGTGSADPGRTNWIAIGFQPEATPAWVINPGGISMIFRGNGGYQIFANGGDITPQNPTPVVGYTQGAVADMSITYDSVTNTATFVINGQVVFTSGNLGAFADKAKRPFVTMYDAGMWFDNFTVSMEGGVLPIMIVPQSPANGAVQLPVDTSLTWAPVFPVAEDLKFDVYLDPNEALVTSLDPSTRVSSQQAGFSYTPAAPLAYETTYYWRILPYINGEPNQPTDVRNFSTRYEVQKWSHVPWVSDADLDISPGKIYTHKVKFNANSEAWNTRVLGVLFENTTDRTGTTWSMTGAVNPYDAASQFPGTGEGRALTNRFFYGSPSTLTLNGLTPGVQYRTTLYTHSWGDPAGRVVAVAASDDGKVNLLDENMDGGYNGRLFMYTYTAPASGSLTFTFTETVFNASWHHYAFSNEVLADIYLNPSPVPDSAVANNVNLSWQLNGEVADPSYHLYVATDAAMTNLLVDTDLPDSTYPLNLTPNTNYYWKVVVKDGGVVVHTSPVWDFTTKWSGTAWMSDTDLDISAGKIYTHKVKFNAISEAFLTTVKGVQFENDTNRSGTTWSLTGAGNSYPNASAFAGTGEGGALLARFFYGHPSALTLNGLTPGVLYRASLYTHGWGDAGGRVVRIASSDDGRGTVLDENIGGNGVGHVFMYTYTAPESGTLTLQFNACMDASWHQYAFSNEIVPDIYLDPTPVPGSAVQGASDLSWKLHGEVANPSYKLYVATDAGMQNLVVQQPVAGTTYHINLSPETSYYWKVEVLDGGSLVHTSPVWNFTTLVPPDAAKVLEWKMDESSGPIAYQTGTSEDADGALMGFNDPNASSMFVTGLVGNAILLNGTTEYVDVSVANPYMPTGDEQAFAVSAYFRTFKPYGPIFSMRNSANGTPLIDITIGHDGAYEAAGKLRMLARDDQNNLGPARDSGILVNDGRWHSMVIMRASGNWIMYVDGIERSRMSGVASGSVTLDWLTIGAEKMWIFDSYGSWNGTRTDIRYFEGMLDEVCIWAGEMQPHQIAELAAIVPPAGDMDFDRDTDPVDLKMLAENWLTDSFTPVQSSPVILEDMESYTNDPNSFKDHWEALNGGVSLENVYGNVATAPTSATVGSSVNSIVDDALYGKVLKWDYVTPADKTNAIQRFWLRDRRIDLAAYDHIRIRVKKLAGSTGDRFYFDFHDGRGMTNPEQGIFPWVLAWQGRIIMGLADLPADQWVTLEADIPGGFNGGGRPKQIHDFYEVTIGINSAGVARAGTILIDEIVLTDSTTDCFATVGELLPDMTGDCRVNIEDFAVMAANWLKGM